MPTAARDRSAARPIGLHSRRRPQPSEGTHDSGSPDRRAPLTAACAVDAIRAAPRQPANQSLPADRQPANARPGRRLEVLRTQVMLDRAGFSPGAIDGQMGANTKKALEQYQKQAPASPASIEPLTTYTITAADAAGPFVPSIPADLAAAGQAVLARLHVAARSARRALSLDAGAAPAAESGSEVRGGRTDSGPERRAADRARGEAGAESGSARGRRQGTRRTPGGYRRTPRRAGAQAAEHRRDASRRHGHRQQGRVRTDRRRCRRARRSSTRRSPPAASTIRCRSASGRSTASSSIRRSTTTPICSGTPTRRTPRPSSRRARTIRSASSGSTLSKAHYGLHGTPEPSTIGRTQSHGCVRLTNWDALKLAGLVKPGTRVVFSE